MPNISPNTLLSSKVCIIFEDPYICFVWGHYQIYWIYSVPEYPCLCWISMIQMYVCLESFPVCIYNSRVLLTQFDEFTIQKWTRKEYVYYWGYCENLSSGFWNWPKCIAQQEIITKTELKKKTSMWNLNLHSISQIIFEQLLKNVVNLSHCIVIYGAILDSA